MALVRWTKRALLALLLLLVLAPAVILALLNRGPVTVDLAFAEFTVAKPLAFTAVFGFGWLFGLLCAAGAVIRRRAGGTSASTGEDRSVKNT